MGEAEHCTRCRKPLTEFRVDINFHMRVDRLKEDSSWEYIPNMDNESREVVCVDCFNEFTDLMSTLNKKYQPEAEEK